MRNFRLDRDAGAPVVRAPVETAHYDRREDTTPGFVSDLRILWQSIADRWRLVVGCTVAALALAMVYIWVVPPTYSSTAEVLIDPRQRAVFEHEIVPSGMGQSSLGADTFLLDSQADLMTSQSVLRRLITELDLINDPDIGVGVGGGGGVTQMIGDMARLVLRGPRAASMPRASGEDQLLAALQEDFDVRRKGNTYVLAVSMKSPNPVTSATIVNTLTSLYMQEIDAHTRARIGDVEEQLGGRLAELREAALESQQRVEAYRAENGLLSAERLTVVEQQLRDLNQQLSVVATTTNAARARWEEVARLSGQPVDRVLASGTLDSPLLDSLRQQYSSYAAREASLSATLMPRHPSLQAVRDSKAAVQADINREVDRLVSRYRVEFDVAVANEDSIRRQIAGLETATAASNQATVGLRGLEREAASDAAIYEQFLTRSKDAREQVNLSTETARVISTARPDFKPSWPSPFLLLPAALVVGLGIGICLAVAFNLFGGTPRPAPRKPVRSLLDGARA